MPRTLGKRTVREAEAVLDGIVAITKNDMLVHGSYLTEIINERLAAQGSVCGGRAACLLGSALLATPRIDLDRASMDFPGAYATALRSRPGLRLAVQTLDEVAVKRAIALRASLKGKSGLFAAGVRYLVRSVQSYEGEFHASVEPEPGRIAESYFEHVLGTRRHRGRTGSVTVAQRPVAATREEVIATVREAKRTIRAQVRRAERKAAAAAE